MSNTVTLLAKQRAAPLPHTALRRVRHRLGSVYTLTCATTRLARSERARWERVSWRGPYAPLRLECTPASRYLRACTRRWALWSRRRQRSTPRCAARLGLLFASALSPPRSPPRPARPTSSVVCTDRLLRDPHGPSLFRNSEFYRRFLFYVYIQYFHKRENQKHL